MISSLILLSAAGVFATPVFISDVKASREAGHLRVEVRADGGIDPESARTVIDDGRLVIYLGGARVRADNRSWELQDGAGEIRAHRHKKETELVVPLTGNGCDGPVELTGTNTGITALVGCEDSVAASSGAGGERKAGLARTVAAAGAAPAARPVEARDVVAPKVSSPPRAKPVTLQALVELPEDEAPVGEAAVKVPAPTVEKPPVAAAPAPPVAVAVEPLHRVAAALPVAPLPATPVPAPRQPVAAANPLVGVPVARVAVDLPVVHAPGAAAASPSEAGPLPASGGSSLRTVTVPALLLAALAVAAYLLARRRRKTFQRHIEILETTSLGPKRSLVVARIGDETLILGSSEAGITLLRGSPAALPAAVASQLASQMTAAQHAAGSAADVVSVKPEPAAAPSHGEGMLETDQPLEEALADIPEPDNAGRGGQARAGFRAIEGGLAGLFGKRGAAFQRDAAPPVFDDLLEDSIEDQELRRKLAAGLSSRVR